MLELYALSLGAAKVHRLDPLTGEILGDVLDAGANNVRAPAGLAILADGTLIVSGYHSDNIAAYDGNGTFLHYVSEEIRRPTTGTLDPDGMLLIGGFGEEGESEGTSGRDDRAERCRGACACKIVRFDPHKGTNLGIFADGGGLNGPDGVHFGPDGNLYVSSFRSDQILRYNGRTGSFIDVFAEHPELDGASGLCFTPDGRLFVCSWYTAQLMTFNATTGAFLGPFADGAVAWPNRLAVSPDQTLYVSSLANNRISRYALDGGLLSHFEGVAQPTDLVLVERRDGIGYPIR